MMHLIKKIVPLALKRRYRDYRKQKKIQLYSGDNVLCPVCNSKFRIFEPFGLIQRENAKCPQCGSLERHRLLWKYLNEKTDFFKKKIKLLHFAPEEAFYYIFSENQNIDYVPCDLFPEQFGYKGGATLKEVNITNIPYHDETFDVVLCNHVLEHIPDDIKAMSELYRVMKTGAWGILQVPIDDNRENTYEDFSITSPKEREKAFGQSDHVRCYGKDYTDRLKSIGFNVKEDDYIKSFSQEELFIFGLISSELIYCCEK
jgi:SAM-dependent methyltransferase